MCPFNSFLLWVSALPFHRLPPSAESSIVPEEACGNRPLTRPLEEELSNVPLTMCMKLGEEFDQTQKTIINSPLTPNPSPATCLLSAHESQESERICCHFLTFPSQLHLCNPPAAPTMPLTCPHLLTS